MAWSMVMRTAPCTCLVGAFCGAVCGMALWGADAGGGGDDVCAAAAEARHTTSAGMANSTVLAGIVVNRKGKRVMQSACRKRHGVNGRLDGVWSACGKTWR